MNKWTLTTNQEGLISVLVPAQLTVDEALDLADQLLRTARALTGPSEQARPLIDPTLMGLFRDFVAAARSGNKTDGQP